MDNKNLASCLCLVALLFSATDAAATEPSSWFNAEKATATIAQGVFPSKAELMSIVNLAIYQVEFIPVVTEALEQSEYDFTAQDIEYIIYHLATYGEGGNGENALF